MADPQELSDEEILLQGLSGRMDEILDAEPEPTAPFPGEAYERFEETTKDIQFAKQIPPTTSGADITSAFAAYRRAFLDDYMRQNKEGWSDEKMEAAVDDESYLVGQHPYHRAIAIDRPSVSQLKNALEARPELAETGIGNEKMFRILQAIDQGDYDSAEEMVKEAPASLFAGTDLIVPTTAFGQLFNATKTKMYPITPSGIAKPRVQAQKAWLAAERKYRAASNDGEKSWIESIKEAWTGQTKMTVEEAKEMGMMRGDQNKSFWRPVEMWEGGPMVAGGFRDLIARTAIVSGAVEHIFAPIILEGKDLERFKRELSAAEPTEAMEHIAMTVRLARERGESEESIKKELRDELGRNLLSYSYRDFPEEAQLKEPSLKLATRYIKSNRQIAMQRELGQISRFATMVLDDDDKEDLQRMLNTVPFGQLPHQVWTETIPSTRKVVDRLVDGIEYIIGAQDASGYPGTLSLERGAADWLLTEEVIDGRVHLVESSVARWMSLVGGLTETVAEARLPFDIPITPASRDFYYNFGKRPPDSTWWSRLLANIETREMGFTRHLTDEALWRGYDRGDPWYHMFAVLGLGLDLFVPWESGQYAIASAPARSTFRGVKTLRALKGFKGYRKQAFFAGAMPRAFQRLKRVGKRAQMASERLAGRFPETPTVGDLRDALARTGDDALSYDETWLADQILPLMERKKNPLSFQGSVDQVKVATKTAVWENVSHIVETAFRNKFDTPDGKNLYDSLPPKLTATVRRIIDTVADYRDVENQLGLHFTEQGKLHVALLNIMLKHGDPETAVLRMSDEYQHIMQDVSELVLDGTIAAGDFPVIMGYLETQAIRAAIDGSDRFSKFKKPADYFANTVVRGPDPGTGAKWVIESRIPSGDKVGKKVIRELSLDSNQAKQFSEFFRNGDIEALFTKMDPDALNHPLRVLMGEKWLNKLYKEFDHVMEITTDSTPRPFLTDRGKAQLANALNLYFEGGAGSVGHLYRYFTDFQSRFGVYWTRIASYSESIGTKLEVRDKFFKIFDPVRVLEDDAISIASRGFRVPPKVSVEAGIEGMRKGAVSAYGRQREFWDVEFQPEIVRHALGITEDVEEMSAADLFSRAVGYAVGEHFKRQVGATKLHGLTARSHVSVERVDSINKAVGARIAKVLGTTQDTLKNADNTLYILNEMQEARMRVFLRQLANEPLAKIVPERLFSIDADLSTITNFEFSKITEALRDIEAGVFSAKTHYSMAIPESVGKALWVAIRSSVDRAAGGSAVIAEWRAQTRKAFVVPDDLKHVIGPAQREVVEKHLMRLERAGAEVFEWAQKAFRGNKEITMEEMFDKLRRQLTPPVDVDLVDEIGGHMIQRPKLAEGMEVKQVPAKYGYLDLLEEFTDAEKNRYKLHFEAEQKAKAEGKPFKEPRPDAILVGKGDDITATEFAARGIELPEGTKKLDFLLKPTTIKRMQALVSGSEKLIDSLSDELVEAFGILERYRGKNAQTFSNQERMALGKALERVRDALRIRKEQIITRGRKIMVGLGGEPGQAVLTNVVERQVLDLYKKFYSGKWRPMIDEWLQKQKGLEAGTEDIGGTGRRKIPQYRTNEAFLGLIVRLRAYEIMGDLADDMVRYGMPADMKKFSKPKPILNAFGEIIASPIDAESKYWERVRFYIEQDLNFSMTRVEERLYKVEEVEKRSRMSKRELAAYEDEKKLVAKRMIEPQAPGRELWAEGVAGPDYGATKGGIIGNPHDFHAYSTAQEVIARYGHRYRPEQFVEYIFPSGQKGLVPRQLVTEIDAAIDRASPIGTARVGTVPKGRSDRAGSPIGIEPRMTIDKKAEDGILRFVDFVAEHFPVTMQHMKMGVTSGIFVPNPAYFFGVGMGGMFQLYQGMGPLGTARSIFKNNGMTTAVVARMWKDGEFAPGNPILIAKDGTSYTADQVTELAQMYGLKSGFIFAEVPQSLAKKMNKLRAKGINRVYWSAAEWQRSLIEAATALDNYYRVSVFVDALERGESAASAAKLARKVAFDYADLTDVEKSTFRNIFMFYSYMRKNMDLFWDTLLTNPDRIIGQLRLMKGIQNAYIEEDTEVRLFERDYAKSRLTVGFRKAAINTHMVDKWMYITPPMPVYDAWGILIELMTALQGDEEAQRYIVTQVNPWIQAPWVIAGQKDFFYNKDINRFNQVPPFLVHFDRTLMGGMFSEAMKIEAVPQADLSRRYVEGEEYAGYYHAGEGRLWWLWKNAMQFPLAGRSMDTLSYIDRANLGLIELLANISRSIHEYGATVGAWERNKKLPWIHKDEMGPRTGLTETDELLGLIGIKAFPLITSPAAHQKVLYRWKEAIGKMRFEEERTAEQRTIKRRMRTTKETPPGGW